MKNGKGMDRGKKFLILVSFNGIAHDTGVFSFNGYLVGGVVWHKRCLAKQRC